MSESRFVRTANLAVQVDPNGTQIIGAGTAGQYLQLDAVGDLVRIEALGGTAPHWVVTRVIGTPTYH